MIFAIDNIKGSISRIGDYLIRYTTISKISEESFLEKFVYKPNKQIGNEKVYVLLAVDNSSVAFIKKVISTHIKIIAIQEDFANNPAPSAYAESLYKQNLLIDSGALVLGVSLLFGTGFTNFAEYVIENVKNKITIDADEDLYVHPVLVDEAAEYLYQHIDMSGYFRLLNRKQISLFHFACDVCRSNSLDLRFINKAPTDYSIFDSASNQDATITDYYTSIQRYSNQKKCLFNLIYKLKPYEYFERESVASIRYDIGMNFSSTIPSDIVDDIDFIVPIPQTGITYANGIADGLDKPMLYAISQKSNTSETFIVADVFKRKSLIMNKLEIVKEIVKNKKIGLVDEAVFTGATLKLVCESLRAYDVEKIHVLIPSPLGTKRCTNYVHPNRIVVGERKIYDISAYFSADTITFGDKSLFSQYNDFCSDCI